MADDQHSGLQQALEGRLPVLPHERIYTRYGSLLWTTAVLSAASYAYLVGGALAAVGNTRLAIAGYLVGLIVGELVVVLAVGVQSYRVGVDTVDAAKSALGIRGAGLILAGVLATCLGWAYVLVAMTAEGIGSLTRVVIGPSQHSQSIVIGAALVIIGAVWLLVRRGPAAMERLSRLCAPGQIAIAAILLVVLMSKYGAETIWAHSAPATEEQLAVRLMQLAFGIEFGFANALSVLPYLGGLARLVRHRHHLVGPTVLGSGIVGAWFIAAVAALAAATEGNGETATWILALAGPLGGSAVVAFLLVANLGTLVVQIYVGAVAAQQVRWIAGLRWDWILVLALLPGVLLAFRTQWLLAHVGTWLGYNGVMFVGLAGVMVTDYFLMRRQRIELAHLFARPGQGSYWFVGGVNWPAMLAIVVAGTLYLSLFNPVTLTADPSFRFCGAGIPAVIVAAVCYWLATRLTVAFWPAMPTRHAPNGKRRTLEIGI
ncbi:MAG: cytosine permease [Dehalococcoidia bacterium]